MNQYVALANCDAKEVIVRVLGGESTVDIAKQYGVTRWALNKHLLKHAEEDWKDAQVARALARKEQAEDDLDKITKEAMDMKSNDLQLTKDDAPMMNVKLKAAEIRLKAANWDLERVCKRIFGTEQQNNQGGGVVINIGIKRGEKVIEATAERLEDASDAA